VAAQVVGWQLLQLVMLTRPRLLCARVLENAGAFRALVLNSSEILVLLGNAR
jgi:hypothetical protein